MSERVVKVSFFPLLGALIATFLLSALVAMATGYTYGLEIRVGTYPVLVKALGPVIGATVIGLIIVTHTFRMRQERIEQDLLRWLEQRGDSVPRQWDADIERTLVENVDLGNYGPEGYEVEQALDERRDVWRLRRYAARLFAIPLITLTIIVAISIWAIPASGAFLDYQATLNTTLIFLTTYGAPMAAASFVVAVLLTMRD
jgi:ABC-type transport system involved in cytochrome c biogenesis permease subunit